MNEYDKKLLRFLCSYKENFEKIQKESLKYKFDINREAFETQKISATDKKGKKYVFEFIPVGVINGNTFNWYQNINKSFYSSLMKVNIETFKKETIHKLFNNGSITLDKEFVKVIPYILSILLPDFNVIEAVTPDKKTSLYFLANTKLKDKFDYEGFLNLSSMYDHLDGIAKKANLKRTPKALASSPDERTLALRQGARLRRTVKRKKMN
jgi:hypothetical protein